MVEAGGTTTLKRIANVGEYELYEIKNDSWDSTETITIPTTATQIPAESKVVIIGATNETTESTMGDGVIVVAYNETTQAFSATEAGAASDVLRILFYVVV